MAHKYIPNRVNYSIMSPPWKITQPKNDADYFERLTKSVFTAGLTWTVVENKWPSFRKAFLNFSPERVSKFSERNIKTLIKDPAIVRNEKKIRATVFNAGEFLELQKDYGSFKKYLDSFRKDEERLLSDVQEKFHHLGPSTARTFLWASACPLTPNAEEKKWMATHKRAS
ncbi:MAG TPA: DNA-3-methyladenine glycosylase I [Candidatus Bathyarchaeia archaeon]|nr:DNA-3-methyladenine glycosylase I [Candidatus Bathyarchaeia archaeon]